MSATVEEQASVFASPGSLRYIFYNVAEKRALKKTL